MRKGLVLSAVAVASIQACSGDDSPGKSTGQIACTPGQQVSCPCSGSGSGQQVCSAKGNSYGPCICPDGGKPSDGSNAQLDHSAEENPIDVVQTEDGGGESEVGIDAGSGGTSGVCPAPALAKCTHPVVQALSTPAASVS